MARMHFAVLLLLGMTVCHSPCFAEDPPPADDKEESRQIVTGGIDYITLTSSPRNVHVGKPDLMKVEQSSGALMQFKLMAQKKGSTTVAFEDDKGHLIKKLNYTINDTDLSQKTKNIRQLLSDIEGIEVSLIGDRILIDGELIVPKDFDRLLQVQEAYKADVLNLVTLSRISREALARRMQKEINDDPTGANVSVKIINNTFFLMGKVDSAADRQRVEDLAATYLPELQTSIALDQKAIVSAVKPKGIINLIVVEEAPPAASPKMVRVTFHFVEIGKEFFKSSFFKWVPMLSESSGFQIGQSTTGGVAASGNGSFVGTGTSLLPKIQSGANRGFVRVLDSIVQLGEENTTMELVRKDAVPYIAAMVNNIPISATANVELNVKVKPTILGQDSIRLETGVQFQALKGAGGGAAPAVTTTNLSNVILVKSGESAALGGLVTNDTAKDIDRDPEKESATGGNAIFTLLRSKSFRNKKTEFVVFITPKVITDASEGTADIKSKIINNKKRRRVVR